MVFDFLVAITYISNMKKQKRHLLERPGVEPPIETGDNECLGAFYNRHRIVEKKRAS